MRILLIGDIVGKPGRQIVRTALKPLRAREGVDFVIANGENASGGSGITPQNYRELIDAGVDCITLGDHIYRHMEIAPILERDSNIIKPANYPQEAPGRGWTVLPSAAGVHVAVVSVLGRVFMRPVDCPFAAVQRTLSELPADIKVIVVDFHAEATSDKQLMGRLLDGRVSAVLGTHTHVPTADEELFPGGTAFQCDVGMTGPYCSILGRDIAAVKEATLTFRPAYFHVAKDDVRLSGTLVDVDPATGRAQAIRRLMVREADLAEFGHDAAPARCQQGPPVM